MKAFNKGLSFILTVVILYFNEAIDKSTCCMDDSVQASVLSEIRMPRQRKIIYKCDCEVNTNEPIGLRCHVQATYESPYEHLRNVTRSSLHVQSHVSLKL